MTITSQERADVYTRVTNQIIKALEQGITDNWVIPWKATDTAFRFPTNIATGKRYRGVNVIALWAESQIHGYPEPTWGTFKQWAEIGHYVAKGQKAATGVLWKPIDQAEFDNTHNTEGDGETDRNKRWIVRAFPLFNAAQIEGYEPPPEPPLPPQMQRIEHAEAFFAALGADIRHGGNRAFYRNTTDNIQMPPFAAFPDELEYYSTLAHEVTHWSGHPSRLARDLKGRFGSESYAAEELIAELGAAFIAADLGLSPDPREENAAYIDNWLKILKSDNRAIFTAASHAQRAADYMHNFQPAVRVEFQHTAPQLAPCF